MGRQKIYFTDEERRAARLEIYHKANHKYYNTPMGRALNLLNGYRNMDIKNGFGDCIDFDAQWIVDNIFTQKCAHCDCIDWRQLGCNRIDNSKPHTKDNVEPCCWKHNHELANDEQSIPIAQYDKNSGELVAVWKSARDIERQLGYSNGNINKCCNRKLPQAYGFVWRKLTIEEYEILRACLG